MDAISPDKVTEESMREPDASDTTADEKAWTTGHKPGPCTWPAYCGRQRADRLTTHVVEWPPGSVENVERFRTYACLEDAEAILAHQNREKMTVGGRGLVVMREVGPGAW